MNLQLLLSGSDGRSPSGPTGLFALLNLGLVESLANGMISPDEAIRLFYNAENCLYVSKHLRKKVAAEIMSRGTQLPDLFESLRPDEALREFQHELSTIRALCLQLLEKKQLVA